MKLPELKIGDLTARYPIVQGGMGIGISLSGLAGAVAKEGGVGIISAAQPGFNEPDFFASSFKANCRILKQELKKPVRPRRTASSASTSCPAATTMTTT